MTGIWFCYFSSLFVKVISNAYVHAVTAIFENYLNPNSTDLFDLLKTFSNQSSFMKIIVFSLDTWARFLTHWNKSWSRSVQGGFGTIFSCIMWWISSVSNVFYSLVIFCVSILPKSISEKVIIDIPVLKQGNPLKADWFFTFYNYFAKAARNIIFWIMVRYNLAEKNVMWIMLFGCVSFHLLCHLCWSKSSSFSCCCCLVECLFCFSELFRDFFITLLYFFFPSLNCTSLKELSFYSCFSLVHRASK